MSPSQLIGYAPESAPALKPFRADGRVLESPLMGVSHEAWTAFVFAMKVALLNEVSPSNGLGLFDMRYKRLADLGLVVNPRYRRDPVTNRSVQIADWVAPLTQDAFLGSASVQYKAFCASMQRYADALLAGQIALPEGGVPEDMSLSGMLVVLHRGGPSALKKWNDQKFESTAELYARVNGVF